MHDAPKETRFPHYKRQSYQNGVIAMYHSHCKNNTAINNITTNMFTNSILQKWPNILLGPLLLIRKMGNMKNEMSAEITWKTRPPAHLGRVITLVKIRIKKHHDITTGVSSAWNTRVYISLLISAAEQSGLKYASPSKATGMHVHNFRFLQQKKRYGVSGKRKWQR
jgi:hypothetical protein